MTTNQDELGEGGNGFETLVDALSQVQDSASLRAVMAARPDLFDPAMIEELRQLRAVPGLGEAIVPFLRLIERVHENPENAWQHFRRSMEERAGEEQRVGAIIQRANAMAERGEYDAAAKLAEETLRFTDQEGYWVQSADLHFLLSTCFRLRGGDVRANLDKAIDHMALAAGGAPHPYFKAERLINLAGLWGMRVNGDPNQNLETALRILEEAHVLLDSHAPIHLRVLAMNNLMRTFQIREEGVRLENLRESLRIGEEAAELTPATEDPERWALVRINLAETIRRLAAEGQAELSDAEERLREVADARELEGFETFRGVASAALGEIHQRRARQIAEESGRIGLGGGEPSPPGDAERRELDAAERRLHAACELIDPSLHGWHLGSALDQLAHVYWLSGEDEKEIETYREAIEVQTANAASALLMQSGFGLGLSFAQRGEWVDAAEAFGTALEAGKANFHARLDNTGRHGELRRAGNVARWAAFALAKTGEIEQAIVVLENGRTQDVRRRLGRGIDEATLSSLPVDAREAYSNSVAKLSTPLSGEAADQAAREVQEVITAIRNMDGFENFATDIAFSQIVEAVEPDWPLVYVNPTPWGTVLLSVRHAGDNFEPETHFLEEVSGEELILDLQVRDWRSGSPKFSYLALAAGGRAFLEEKKAAIDDALSRLSPIAERVAAYLRDIDARGVTLISSGLVSVAPLHAAPWPEGETPTCLLDRFQVRSAPSAAVHAACLERARASDDPEPSLLALGNPDLDDPELDLPGAEREVREIAHRFPHDRRVVALRAAATADFLEQNVSNATHLHLACHASGGLFDYADAELHLADRSIKGAELETLPISARVSVLSACQTAQLDMSNLPDEVSSMSTAVLVAGSPAVVATQWPVKDRAAALLMARFYEDLIDNGMEVGEALRRSQLWLRDSEPSGEFAHPLFWAPFVLAGA